MKFLIPEKQDIFLRASVCNICNFSCQYCPKDLGMENHTPQCLKAPLLKTHEYVNNMKLLAQHGFKAVSFTGGEQIYKLILSMAGFEKYYQFAHCFRPIESESDSDKRLCEFVQLDIEMKASTLSELTKLAESLITEICSSINTNPRIEYMDGLHCRKKYGNEMKPDLRKSDTETSIVFIERIPLTNGEKTKEGTLIPCHHIFALSSADIAGTPEDVLENASTESFDIVINGIEVGGGDLRIMSRELQEKVMDIFDVDKKRYDNYLRMLENYNGKQNGGFAFGIERLVMALSGCHDITQTVAFPDFYKMGSC